VAALLRSAIFGLRRRGFRDHPSTVSPRTDKEPLHAAHAYAELLGKVSERGAALTGTKKFTYSCFS
jgi:hypothetical protein